MPAVKGYATAEEYAAAQAHEWRSGMGATANRWIKESKRKASKSHHASIRAERRRKRKAKQARKGHVDAREGKRRAEAWVRFCGSSHRK